MAKFSRVPKLSKREREKLMVNFCECLATVKNAHEAARFLTDLLSPAEAEMLAKRLKIAEFLLKNWDYASIREELKVGFSTIARVNAWLSLAGEGYKLVLSRRPKGKYQRIMREEFDPWTRYKTKQPYGLYFWPFYALEEILKESDRKHKDRIISILQSMDSKKNVFSKEMNRFFYEKFGRKNRKKWQKKK